MNPDLADTSEKRLREIRAKHEEYRVRGFHIEAFETVEDLLAMVDERGLLLAEAQVSARYWERQAMLPGTVLFEDEG